MSLSAMSGTVSDFSDANFSIAAPPTLAVTSPNGGESWQAGTTHNITWASTNVTGTIQIQPYLNGVAQANINPTAPNTGSYSWSIPTNYTPGSTYRIALSAMSGTVSDFSDNFFTISTQPSRQGVDYSYSHPDPIGLKAAGYDFAIRYVSGSGAPKNLTASEAQALQNAGIDIIVIFESTAGRILDGYNAGVADANTAVTVATVAGAPQNFFCYFACDIDATPSDQTAINAYLDGAASALGGVQRVGLYAGYWPLSRALDAGKAAKGWQTTAWSGGNKDSRISLYQHTYDVSIAGGTCDINDGYGADLGQWSVVATPTLAVTSPNGGESWQAGTTHNITWVSSNVAGTIQIQPYSNGVPQVNINPTAPNTGSYSWSIPSNYAPGSTYKIALSAMSGTVSDFSDGNFTITARPEFTVANPTLVGQAFSVTVSSVLGSNYTLQYKNSFTDAEWTAAQTLSGTGGTITLTDGMATNPARFYRGHVE